MALKELIRLCCSTTSAIATPALEQVKMMSRSSYQAICIAKFSWSDDQQLAA